jgi:hypothetical protein
MLLQPSTDLIGYIMIKRNLGSIDRALRIAVGAGLRALVFIRPQTPWGYLGLIPWLTGIVGVCPALCPSNSSMSACLEYRSVHVTIARNDSLDGLDATAIRSARNGYSSEPLNVC